METRIYRQRRNIQSRNSPGGSFRRNSNENPGSSWRITNVSPNSSPQPDRRAAGGAQISRNSSHSSLYSNHNDEAAGTFRIMQSRSPTPEVLISFPNQRESQRSVLVDDIYSAFDNTKRISYWEVASDDSGLSEEELMIPSYDFREKALYPQVPVELILTMPQKVSVPSEPYYLQKLKRTNMPLELLQEERPESPLGYKRFLFMTTPPIPTSKMNEVHEYDLVRVNNKVQIRKRGEALVDHNGTYSHHIEENSNFIPDYASDYPTRETATPSVKKRVVYQDRPAPSEAVTEDSWVVYHSIPYSQRQTNYTAPEPLLFDVNYSKSKIYQSTEQKKVVAPQPPKQVKDLSAYEVKSVDTQVDLPDKESLPDFFHYQYQDPKKEKQIVDLYRATQEQERILGELKNEVKMKQEDLKKLELEKEKKRNKLYEEEEKKLRKLQEELKRYEEEREKQKRQLEEEKKAYLQMQQEEEEARQLKLLQEENKRLEEEKERKRKLLEKEKKELKKKQKEEEEQIRQLEEQYEKIEEEKEKRKRRLENEKLILKKQREDEELRLKLIEDENRRYLEEKEWHQRQLELQKEETRLKLLEEEKRRFQDERERNQRQLELQKEETRLKLLEEEKRRFQEEKLRHQRQIEEEEKRRIQEERERNQRQLELQKEEERLRLIEEEKRRFQEERERHQRQLELQRQQQSKQMDQERLLLLQKYEKEKDEKFRHHQALTQQNRLRLIELQKKNDIQEIRTKKSLYDGFPESLKVQLTKFNKMQKRSSQRQKKNYTLFPISDSVQQTIDVKEEENEVKGMSLLFDAKPESYSESYNTVDERVSIKIEENNATMDVIIIYEVYNPLDLEQDQWQRQRVIITRLIFVDLNASQETRKAFDRMVNKTLPSLKWTATETINLTGSDAYKLYNALMSVVEEEIESSSTKSKQKSVTMDTLPRYLEAGYDQFSSEDIIY